MKSSTVQTKPIPKKSIKNKIFDQILPITGSISYEIFAVHIMNPEQFTRIVGNRSSTVADVLWLNAHIGFGVYLYHQDCLKAARLPWKLTYSVFGSAMFNFGSVLMWGTSKVLFPKLSDGLRVLFGLGSGLLLLYRCWNFTDFLNMNVLQRKEYNESDGCG